MSNPKINNFSNSWKPWYSPCFERCYCPTFTEQSVVKWRWEAGCPNSSSIAVFMELTKRIKSFFRVLHDGTSKTAEGQVLMTAKFLALILTRNEFASIYYFFFHLHFHYRQCLPDWSFCSECQVTYLRLLEESAYTSWLRGWGRGC